MLIHLRAKFECDDCGIKFEVNLDPALDVTTGWSLFDYAVDALRGDPARGMNGDKHRCIDCLKKEDDKC